MSSYFLLITQEEADWIFARLVTHGDEEHDKAYALLKGEGARLIFDEDAKE